VEELATSFNKGLLARSDDNDEGEPASDDDYVYGDDDDDIEDSDDESDDKPVTMGQKILLKAKEHL